MDTLKNRLRERLDVYLLPELREEVIEDLFEVLEEPTQEMLDRGGDQMIGSLNGPMAEAVAAIWLKMVRTAQQGG